MRVPRAVLCFCVRGLGRQLLVPETKGKNLEDGDAGESLLKGRV
jgi:hypothetical protein